MNLNIAICDDNQKIRKQYCDFCKKYYQTRNDLHVNISTFISAEQMLQGTTCFDYIFTDIQLIDMNGLEMIKKIRETNIDVLIVIISGFPEYLFDSVSEENVGTLLSCRHHCPALP